ncbi:MAG: hypothetical protein IJ946_01580 [Clostridia bacterium]|nr:hypothetical protein [Clostridia bacterium]
MNNSISNIITATADKAEGALKENSVFGEPITVDGATIIPVYKLSFGFGGGAFDGMNSKNKASVAGGAGAGVTKLPISFVTIKEGEISVLSAEDPNKQSFISTVLSLIKKK